MHTRYQLIFTFISFILGAANAQTTIAGGKGMLRIYEAETVTAGDIYVNPFASFYTVADHDRNVLRKDNTLNIGITLGISRVFETFIHLTPYQTDQKHLWGTVGDSKVGLKAHNPRPGLIQYGALAYADLATGQTHAVHFEPYSEKAFGYTALGLLTLDFRRSESPLPLKVSFNLGLKNHNASSGFLSNETNQLVGGLGCKFPVKSSQVYTELSGELFFNKPEVKFHENSFRWSAGYKTLIKRGIIFDVAADIELGRYKPTPAKQNYFPRFWEDYADWKIIVGLTYRWTVFPTWDKERQLQQKQKEQQQQENNEIKQQREDVIQELQEYQKRLEEEKKQNVPF